LPGSDPVEGEGDGIQIQIQFQFQICRSEIKGGEAMCRNIRTLHNFEPPATEDEIRASAIQFVRKLSGFTKPSKANQAAFDTAVAEVTEAARRLLESLVTNSPPKNRDEEAKRARARAAIRYAS
jgi:hypothetical protein